MNLAPLLRVIGTPKMSLLFLLQGLLDMISGVSSVLAITSVSYVDLAIFLFPRGPLAPGLQKLSPGLEGFYAHIDNCEQISHHLWLLHDDLLHTLDVADPAMESIDDFNVLDVHDIVPDVAEIFHVVSETFIMLLSDGLQGLYCR
jgi:hypothetical protein